MLVSCGKVAQIQVSEDFFKPLMYPSYFPRVTRTYVVISFLPITNAGVNLSRVIED